MLVFEFNLLLDNPKNNRMVEIIKYPGVSVFKENAPPAMPILGKVLHEKYTRPKIFIENIFQILKILGNYSGTHNADPKKISKNFCKNSKVRFCRFIIPCNNGLKCV